MILLQNLNCATKCASEFFVHKFYVWPAFLRRTFDLWVAIKKMNCGIFDRRERMGGRRIGIG